MIDDCDQWHEISEAPPSPVQAELFYGRLTLTDQNGKEVSPIIQPYRDERRQMAYWDGEAWRHMGTGHRVNEFGDDPPEWLPTHWRALPPLPEMPL